MRASTLIVEDNPTMAEGLMLELEREDHKVEFVGDGLAAIRRVKEQHFDLIVLDLMLPHLSGLKVLAYIRANGIPTRVLVLTALTEDVYRYRGLKLGADSYLTKPFSLLIFLAEVEELLRRAPMEPMDRQEVSRLEAELGVEVPDDPTSGRGLYIGRGFVDIEARGVYSDGKLVPLARAELDLLLLLVRHAGEAISYETILREVWQIQFEANTHRVEKTIHRLRHKIEHDPKQPRYIKTVHRFGYRFDR